MASCSFACSVMASLVCAAVVHTGIKGWPREKRRRRRRATATTTTRVLAAMPLHQDLPIGRPGALTSRLSASPRSIVFVQFLGLSFWESRALWCALRFGGYWCCGWQCLHGICKIGEAHCEHTFSYLRPERLSVRVFCFSPAPHSLCVHPPHLISVALCRALTLLPESFVLLYSFIPTVFWPWVPRRASRRRSRRVLGRYFPMPRSVSCQGRVPGAPRARGIFERGPWVGDRRAYPSRGRRRRLLMSVSS